MDILFPLLLVVGCAGGMGLMMWVMMRTQDKQPSQGETTHTTVSAQDDELARLRAEVDQLRAAQRDVDAREEQHPGPG